MLAFVLFLLLASCRFVSISGADDPIICFTFDDQHEGVYRVALPIMQQYGFRGTCFVNSGKLHRPNYMLKNELQSLYADYAWEIGGHTINHENLVNLTYPEARQAIITDYDSLYAWDLYPRSFALPFGECPLEYFPIIAEYYRNIRGSMDTPMHVPLDRLGLGYLPYQSGWNSSVIKARIQRGIAAHEELIIIGFHEIEGATNPYGSNCDSDTFGEIMDYVHNLGLRVLPVDEAVEALEN